MNRLVGLVVKAFASTEEDPGFESRLRRFFVFLFFFFGGGTVTGGGVRRIVIPVTEKLALQ